MCTLTCQKHVNVPMMAANIFVYILNKDNTFPLLLGILTQYLNAVAFGRHTIMPWMFNTVQNTLYLYR